MYLFLEFIRIHRTFLSKHYAGKHQQNQGITSWASTSATHVLMLPVFVAYLFPCFIYLFLMRNKFVVCVGYFATSASLSKRVKKNQAVKLESGTWRGSS